MFAVTSNANVRYEPEKSEPRPSENVEVGESSLLVSPRGETSKEKEKEKEGGIFAKLKSAGKRLVKETKHEINKISMEREQNRAEMYLTLSLSLIF